MTVRKIIRALGGRDKMFYFQGLPVPNIKANTEERTWQDISLLECWILKILPLAGEGTMLLQ